VLELLVLERKIVADDVRAAMSRYRLRAAPPMLPAYGRLPGM
jgi:hypothetical protein